MRLEYVSRALKFGPAQDWTACNLFLCHFLSTWNARSYEFASVLFTAAAFPEGLSAASWIGITTSVAIILFASSLGRWVDHAPSRLRTLLTTVSINRVVVMTACVCWSFIVKNGGNLAISSTSDEDSDIPEARTLHFRHWKDLLFLGILALGIAERLSRLANLLSIERDWVPTLAAIGVVDQQPAQYDLTHLNAVMGRIDLICKLGSPIAMSVFISATESPRLGAFGLLVVNLITWPLEYWTAKTVWHGNERLQETKEVHISVLRDTPATPLDAAYGHNGSNNWPLLLRSAIFNLLKAFSSWIFDYGLSLQQYFSTDIWMPSLAMTSLHFSVLTFSATLTVFLIHSGFSMRLITWAEVLSAVFELSSTFIFPWGVRVLSTKRQDYVPLPEESGTSEPTSLLQGSMESEDETWKAATVVSEGQQRIGVSRLGMWALGFMLLCLIPTFPAISSLSTSAAQTINPTTTSYPSAWQTHHFAVITIILFISASRLGRWTNALCTQQLAQSCVRPEQRSIFAGTEASLSSTFGLGHWVTTVLWSKHEEFHWIALSSLVVTVGSASLYGFWLVRGRKRLES